MPTNVNPFHVCLKMYIYIYVQIFIYYLLWTGYLIIWFYFISFQPYVMLCFSFNKYKYIPLFWVVWELYIFHYKNSQWFVKTNSDPLTFYNFLWLPLWLISQGHPFYHHCQAKWAPVQLPFQETVSSESLYSVHSLTVPYCPWEHLYKFTVLPCQRG